MEEREATPLPLSNTNHSDKGGTTTGTRRPHQTPIHTTTQQLVRTTAAQPSQQEQQQHAEEGPTPGGPVQAVSTRRTKRSRHLPTYAVTSIPFTGCAAISIATHPCTTNGWTDAAGADIQSHRTTTRTSPPRSGTKWWMAQPSTTTDMALLPHQQASAAVHSQSS